MKSQCLRFKTQPALQPENKNEDNTSIIYNCVGKYLDDSSENPQRMVITCGQKMDSSCVKMSVEGISRQDAIDMADSKNFTSAFDVADNRKALRKACHQARMFYLEYTIHKNPFPPRQRFNNLVVESRKQREYEASEMASTVLDSRRSLLSVTESTISLLSSPSNISITSSPSQISLSLPKKKSQKDEPRRARIMDSMHSHADTVTHVPPVEKPKTSTEVKYTKKEENRMMNTFSTSE